MIQGVIFAGTGTMVKVVTDKNAAIGLMIVALVFLGMEFHVPFRTITED